MKKKILAMIISMLVVFTGINLEGLDTSHAAKEKDPNYEYMIFLIMGRFTAYPTKDGSSLQATWNSGNGARTNPVKLGQKVDIHVGSGDGASPNLIPAEEVPKWEIEYVGEYTDAPYDFEWGVDNNYHQYDGWLEDEGTFNEHYLTYAPNDLNFTNYSLDKKGNIVFDLSMTLKERGDSEYNYFYKLRREYEPPSILWDYWGGKSQLQNNDPLFAQEVQRALDNYDKTTWDGYIFPYPFIVVLKRPVAGEGITHEGYFLENGTQLKPYKDTKHSLDAPTSFKADNIAGYEFIGSKQQYETAPIGVSRNGVDNYNITWKKVGNSYNFRKNYIHYYYKLVDKDTGENPPPSISYKSVPESFGEVKEGTYSNNRSTERWNAMAGFPHDSTLFTDIGASFASVDIKTDTEHATTDNSSPSSHDVDGAGIHQPKSCPDGCGGTVCSRNGCPDDGSDCTSCTGHRVQSGTGPDGKPTYTTEYRDHRHGKCGPSTERWVESFPVQEDFTVKAHQIGEYDIKTPTNLTAEISYTDQSPLSLTNSEKVTKEEKEATWDNNITGLTKDMGKYLCSEERRFQQEAYNKIRSEYVANKSHFYYNPPEFSISGLGQKLDFLVNTKAKFVQTSTNFDGTLSYKPEVVISKSHTPNPVTCPVCKGQYCGTCPEGPNHSHDYGLVTEKYCTGRHRFVARCTAKGSCGDTTQIYASCNVSCLNGSCSGHLIPGGSLCMYCYGHYTYRCKTSCGQRETVNGSKCSIDYDSFAHGGGENNYKYWEIIKNSGMNKYQTNFRPKAGNWSAKQIDITGYNGDYLSPSRRGANRELFYEAGLKVSNNHIANGQKETGNYEVEYITTDTRGANVNANNRANSIYSPNHDKVNDVIVHSPISIAKMDIIPKHALVDQRVEGQQSSLQRLTPDSEFSVIFHTTWTGNVMVNAPSIKDITTKTGKGYIYGLQTNQWIKKKIISFPFEVISLWDNKRHGKDTLIELDKNASIYNFYIPVSEREIKEGGITGYLEASNNINQDIKNKKWDTLNEKRYDNNVEDYYFAADHFAQRQEIIDLVGRIGNFEFGYSNDPNYKNLFLKPDLNKPIIKGAWWEVLKPEAYNKYIGPYSDMYQRATKSNKTNGLDRWDAIPRLREQLEDFWPVQGDNNKNNLSGKTINLMNSKLVKLGYYQQFSLQSVGNYDNNAMVTIYPKYKILNTKTGVIKDVGSIYVADGSKYLQSYPYDKQVEQGKIASKIVTKLNTKLRFIEGNEVIRTNLVDSTPLSNDKNINIGNMSKIILDRYCRTYIGGFLTDKGRETEINVKHNNVDEGGYSNKNHAKQGQRWHGSLWLPSSSVFLEPGKEFKSLEDTIDTKEDSVLLVSFSARTENGEGPWNVQTTAETLGGYTKAPELRVYSKSDNSFIRKITLPMGTIATFDLSDRSYEDVTISGIH